MENGTVITISYDDIIPYILMSRMTHEEIDKCEIVELSPQDTWYPYKEGGNFSSVSLDYLYINYIENLYEQTDPISSELYFSWLKKLVSNSPLLVAANSDDRK